MILRSYYYRSLLLLRAVHLNFNVSAINSTYASIKPRSRWSLSCWLTLE